MRKVTTIFILVLALFAFTAMFVTAEEAAVAKKEVKAGHEYVGEAKCKTCHKAQFTSWGETGHATAFSKLSAEEQKDPACVGCHTTGKMADGTMIENVSCEACHGGGADYKSAKIMSKKKWAADPDTYKKMAIEAGLVYPVEADCVRCHKKEGNANFKPFDFEKSKGKVHPVPADK